MQPVNRLSDPAPSRLSYRMQRLMLTPMFRWSLRLGVPLCLILGLGWTYLSEPKQREEIMLMVADLRQQIETRPEFMVNLLTIDGASVAIEEDIRETFPFDLPVSSFDIELDDVRTMVAELTAVSEATVRIRQGGVLQIAVTERVPAALWRAWDGLQVVDIEGVNIGTAQTRSAHPNLPVLAGEGAAEAVPEALQILRAAAPLQSDLRGLIRMGGRRWDLVLNNEKRILLPETGAVRALERVILLDDVQDALSRDIVVVDMRIGERPTLRLHARSVDNWRQVSRINLGAGQE